MSRAVQLTGSGVQISFIPSGDRFAQHIELGEGAWLEAVNDDAGAADSWPPSPPLQDVHFESRLDGRQLALMIGRAGISHWSISCELDPVASELLFDVACRLKEPAAWLGSTYQLSPGVVFSGDESSGELRMGERIVCQISADHDCKIAWQSDEQRLMFIPQTQSEEPSKPNGNSFPHTIRWRYRLLAISIA